MDQSLNGGLQNYPPNGMFAGQQLAPQGFMSNVFANQGQTGMMNYRPFNPVGTLPTGQSGVLPFDAGPQFAPQGFLGDAFGAIAGPVGSWVGQRFGNQAAGQQIGNLAGQLGQRFIPFDAAPQLAPQGFVGDAFGAIAGPLGGMIGQRFGNQALGQQLGGMAGQLGQRFIPFDAGPQFAPQGFLGDAFGAVAGPLGGMIGQRFGNQALGQQLGGMAGQLGQRFIPFDAAPQVDVNGQLVPQGFLGGLAGSFLGGLGGRAIGNIFHNPNLGKTIGTAAGGLLGGILPLDASPQFVPQGYANVPIASMYPNQMYPNQVYY